MTKEQQIAMQAYLDEVTQFQGRGPVQLSELSVGDLQQLQASYMEQVSTDPRYKDAQLEALRQLEQRSKQGLTAQDEADMFRLKMQTDANNRGRVGAIQQNMDARGMGGSGMSAMMKLQASQDSAEREALRSMEKAAQMQNNKFSASQALGQQSTQMRSQEFNEESAKARAKDSINAFNTKLLNDNTNRNWETRNQNKQNDYNHDVNSMNAGMQGSKLEYDVATEDANRKLLEEQERRRRKAAKNTAGWGAAGAVAGGVIGSVYGGPVGASVGASVGSQAGQSIGSYQSGYAHGGIIPFDERDYNVKPYDDPENDTKEVSVSAGEAIVPKSVVADSMNDPTNSAWNDYMNQLKAKVAEKQSGVDSAQTMNAVGQGASVLTDLLNNYNKGNRQDVVLHNKMGNLGNAPTVRSDEVPQVSNLAGSITASNLSGAQKELASAERSQTIGKEEMRKYLLDKRAAELAKDNQDWRQSQSEKADARDERDFNQRREQIKATKEAKDATTAYNRSEKAATQARLDAKEERATKKADAELAQKAKGKPLTAQATTQVGELDAAEKLINDLESDYKKSASGYGSGLTSALPWSTDAGNFDQTRRQKAQVIGGILEGGKLTDPDFERYYDMMPSPWDTDEQAANKLSELKQTLKAKRETIVETLGKAGFDNSGLTGTTGTPSETPKSNKPSWAK